MAWLDLFVAVFRGVLWLCLLPVALLLAAPVILVRALFVHAPYWATVRAMYVTFMRFWGDVSSCVP